MKLRAFALLIILPLCFCLFSCGTDSGNPPSSESETQSTLPEDTEPSTEPPAQQTVVIANRAGTDYVIIISNGCADSITSLANDMKMYCYAATEARLWVKRAQAEEPKDCEILIGNTGRPESDTVSAGLAAGEYRIVFVGKKLVVAGGSDYAAKAGAKLLRDEYFADKADTIELPADIDIKGESGLMDISEVKAGWNPLVFPASNGIELLYQLYMPADYDASRSYPCILYMHSSGVRCDDNSHIYTAEAKFLRNLETSKYKDEVIVLAPCCPKTDKWVPATAWNLIEYEYETTEPTRYMSAALELFRTARDTLALDETRLYTYGMSMGGFAVYDLLTRNPGVFAAAIPVAGAGDCDDSAVRNFAGTALWIFHGDKDASVPVESDRRMVAALRAVGREDVKYTEFAGLGHGIWTRTADTAGLLDWLFAQKKQ